MARIPSGLCSKFNSLLTSGCLQSLVTTLGIQTGFYERGPILKLWVLKFFFFLIYCVFQVMSPILAFLFGKYPGGCDSPFFLGHTRFSLVGGSGLRLAGKEMMLQIS